MRVVPKSLTDKVQFYQDHLAPFAANAGAIGLAAEEVAALTAKAQAAREAITAQHAAQNAARAATLALNIAVEELGSLGASLILKIRATAEATNNPGIYSLAELPPTAAGSPMEAPGRPYLLETALGGDGSLLLQWKCDNPRGSSGTMYQIARKVVRADPANFGEFIPLAVVGKKQFCDETIPAGATAITYQIQAIRSTKKGTAAEFNVNFGSNGQKRIGSFMTREAA